MTLIVGGREAEEPEPAEPTAPVAPEAQPVVARSIVVSQAGAREEAYRRAMPRVMSRSILRARWQEQQEGRAKRRASVGPGGRERRPEEIVEPPYDLDALAQLLEDSPDFAAVVEQLATDVSGRGWDLVDVEDPLPEPGEPQWAPRSPTEEDALDQALAAERLQATRWLKSLPRDFTGHPLSLADLAKNAFMDYETLGEGYVEVAPDPATGLPVQLFHIQGVYVRKREDGTYAQLDQMGREAAYFRPFDSDPNAPSSRHSDLEAERAGVEPGVPKNELFELRRYHPNELYYGLPLIVSALAAARGNIFCDDRNIRYFINRALPDWVVELKASRATINAPPETNILDRYEEAIREHMNYVLQGDDYRTLILRLPTGEVETTWTKLTTDFEPAGLDEYQMRNRDVIVRVYRMPPHRLGIIEAASLGSGTGESQEETYKRAQIDPRQERWEEFVDVLLHRRGFHRVRYMLRDIDVVDEIREMQLFAMADATGNLSVNEARRWLSRIVADQDFEDKDEDMADVPKYLIEAQAAGAAAEEIGAGMFGQPAPAQSIGEDAEGGGAVPQPAAGGGLPKPALPGVPRTLAVDPAYVRIRREMQALLGRPGQRRERLRALVARARGASSTRVGAPARAGGNGDGATPAPARA